MNPAPRSRARLRWLALWVAPLTWLGCGGGGGTDIVLPSLSITTSTQGVELDPDGYSVAVDGSAAQTIGLNATLTVDPLPDGQHTVALAGLAPNCSAPDNPRTVTVSTGVTVTVAFAVTCGPTSGSIAVTTTTSGAGSDPDGFALLLDGTDGGLIGVSATINLASLTPGAHTLGLTGLAANCQVTGENPLGVTVTSGQTSQVSFAVTCAAPGPSSGTLQITTSTSGPNQDQDGYRVAVDGGTGQPMAVNATLTVPSLSAGAHTVQLIEVAPNCTVSGGNSRSVIVPSGGTVSIAFTINCVTPPPNTGSLQITAATTGSSLDLDGYTVSVDNGAAQAILSNGTVSIGSLTAGSHSVQLSGLASNCTVSGANPRPVTITAGQETAVTFSVTCVATGPSINLLIRNLYITQSSQALTGSVPLVAGRDAYLRVFVVANESNSAKPRVRVLLSTSTQTFTIEAPGASTPMQVQEGVLGSSWNLRLPGSLIQSGLSIVADVDPNTAIDESNETDNRFPTTGTKALTVLTVPPVRIRFVSIQQGSSTPGNVSATNKNQLMDMTRRMYPLNAMDTDVDPNVFTASAPLEANGNGWNQLLSDLDGKRVAEGTSRTYFGVVKLSYGKPGLVGLTLGQGVPTAVGWDDPADATRVVAHELGHTWNQLHTPCGNPPNVDGGYPYGNGIGVYGFDVAAGSLKAPTLPDIMGYCVNPWISDYTYQRVMTFRQSSAVQAGVSAVPQPSLLIWGRIENGRPVLEPAFQIVTKPSLPDRPGPYSVTATALDGSQLFTISFDAATAVDDPRGSRHFAFAVPLDQGGASRVATLRLGGPAGAVTTVPQALAQLKTGAAAESMVARREGENVSLRWNAAAHPMIMVRDPDTGEVLSFARGGTALVRTAKGELDLDVSDGVRSQRVRLAINRS